MKYLIIPILLLTAVAFVSCDTEDPGPLQRDVKEYSVVDFDQLELGSGFNIRVEESNTFRVRVEGDRRNINDLEVKKYGSSLVIEFDEHSQRSHQTFITIHMPGLRKATLSGGSVSVITGFESDGILDLIVSGGSVAQLDAGYGELNLIASGGSTVKLFGLGDLLSMDVSGAASVNAFDYPVRDAMVIATGASSAKVTVSDDLSVNASGASVVTYKGNPNVSKQVSGGSSVNRD